MAAKVEQNSKNFLRLSSVAKDFNLKSKDIVEILAQNGFTRTYTASTVLLIEEFEVLVNVLTKAHQITDINAYLDGRTYIPKKDETKEDVKKAPAEKPAEMSADVQSSKPTEAPADASSQGASSPTPVKPAEKPASEKPSEKQDQSQSQTAPKQPATQNQTQQRPTQNGQQRNQQRTDRPQERTQQSQAPKKRDGERPQQSQQQPPRRDGERPQQSQQQQQQKRDRFSNPSMSGQQSQTQRPPKKDQQAPEQRKPQTITITGSSSDTSSMPIDNSGRRIGTRVIDTRSGTVDLSKYDEKLETYVASEGGYDNQPQKARSKQNQRQGQKPGQGGKSEQQYGKPGKRPEQQKKSPPPVKQQISITVPEEITVGELASRLKVTAAEVIKRLMLLGVMASVNQTIDFDTAEYIGTELGAIVTKEVVVTIEEKLFDDSDDEEKDLIDRAPVVCVMGHVDHGKTSLLDRIRHTSVTAGEAGGITQHIGAYRVSINGKDLTFLDTPGHEAFTAMRARGAKATDIAILVVAADDGIMPQTVEAINHANAAGIDIIVAINKMDKPTANPDNVLQGLTKYNLIPEDWGGDTQCVPVSALTGYGIEDLLETVLLVAEMKQLKANPNRKAKGIIIEARLDKGKGPVATVLVQKGTLKAGDVVIAGTSVGRVRSMSDENGRTLKVAGPSVPVEITGLSEVPNAGDEFNAVDDERMARELAEQRKEKTRQEIFDANAKVSLDDLFNQINEGRKELNIIVKADVDGSAEAVKASLVKISNEEVKVNVIHAAVGGITDSDVMLADASNAIIVGFNVRPDKVAMDNAERQKVDIRTYRVIYECIDEITAAIKGMLAPVYKEQILGHAQVRQTIKVPNVGVIAGSYVQDGKITRNALIRVVRQGIVVYEDKISSLRRFKDDVREVAQGYECGIGLEKFNDIKLEDILEAYEMVQVEQK